MFGFSLIQRLANYQSEPQSPSPRDLLPTSSAVILRGIPASLLVFATDMATAYRALLARRVDLAVVNVIEPLAEESLNVERLIGDPHVVIAGAQNPLTRRCRLKLSDLVNEPWALSPPDSSVRRGRVRRISCARTEGSANSRPPHCPYARPCSRLASFINGAPPCPVMQFPPLKNSTLNPVAELFSDWMREAAKRLRKM